MQGRNQIQCFNTQPPEGGWLAEIAGQYLTKGFNTQPPEGGWVLAFFVSLRRCRFNTQPPEGGWLPIRQAAFPPPDVSTHSRLKAAGVAIQDDPDVPPVFQHTAA